MWSIVRPAALQAARVTGATGSLPARHGLGWLSARVVLNRSASCAYRLTVVARSLATATAKAKTARKPAAAATKATATKPKARAAAAKKLATKKPATKTAKSAKATKTTKGARAAKPKAKSKAAKPKKAAKARKPAKTPEEKLASDKRKLAKSTLSVPTQLPSNSWLVYLKQKIQGKHFNVTQETPTLSKSFKELPAAEVENLKETARANVELNKAAYKAWVESHTPAEVHAANKARSRLRRVHKVSKSMIKDPRLPKRPMTPFFFYIQKGFTPRDPALVKVTDHAKAAASQWNTLGTAERKPFIDMAIADRSRYEVEKKNVGLL